MIIIIIIINFLAGTVSQGVVMMAVSRQLYRRECYGGSPAYRPRIASLEEASAMMVPACVMSGNVVPLFALDFAPRERNVAAIADEEGFVSIVREDDEKDDASTRQFEAHSNAVFDVRWTKDGSRIVTGSGDQTVCVWDAEVVLGRRFRTSRRTMDDESAQEYNLYNVAECRGHAGSVKCVAVNPMSSDVIASGSRDGAIRMWDLRTPTLNGSCCKMEDAHRIEGRPRRRRGRNRYAHCHT